MNRSSIEMKPSKYLSAAVLLTVMTIANAAQGADCTSTSVGLTPINDLGTGTYMSYQGGLYPGGSNQRPDSHEAAGLEIARAIGPMNSSGNPDASGKYVLLSIGMSNASQEFEAFLNDANADPDKDPDLVIVNGAQGGATARDWARSFSPVWAEASQKLAQENVTEDQVAVVWAKFANSATEQTPDSYRAELEDNIPAAINNLREQFPNLKLAYLSSRIYAGYASSTLNPEPFAYESGFVVKWSIESQLDGDAGLNFDPARGTVNAPWLSWGPYFWADGLNPRSDGLIWRCSEMREDDGTHPSDEGKTKVGMLLHEFFTSDTTAREWFLADPGSPVDTVAPMPPENLQVEPQ